MLTDSFFEVLLHALRRLDAAPNKKFKVAFDFPPNMTFLQCFIYLIVGQ